VFQCLCLYYNSNLSIYRFQDEKLFSRLVEWNFDCEEITGELFDILDTNHDGRFTLTDATNLSSEV